MKISVFGLGYVGSVTAACLAQIGHDVIGVDVNDLKVASINDGKGPIVEDQINSIIGSAVQAGKLRATTSAEKALTDSDVSLICVGTPSNGNGSLDLRYIDACCEQLGEGLSKKSGFHTVAIRSTVLPGTTKSLIVPILERVSGKKAGVDFAICSNPEFLREASAVKDFMNPPFTLVGTADEKAAAVVGEMYREITSPLIQTSIEVAEIVKYASNAFHALKVCFANEIGSICKAMGIDSHEAMDIFLHDRNLNLSSSYLKPGFAFGGSCLPKDVRAITYLAKSRDLSTPLLNAILPSNEQQLKAAIEMVTSLGKKRVGIYGLAFKAGTDDLRESPMVRLVEHLLGKGYELRIFDRNVSLSNIFGANREFIEREIPHIERLMTTSFDELLQFGEVIVIGHRPNEEEGSRFQSKTIVDFVRLSVSSRGESYHGLCW
jgi:GDP-mannose 6-dehydrogenase